MIDTLSAQKKVQGLCSTQLTGINDPRTEKAVELALATAIKRAAEARYDKARKAVLTDFADDIEGLTHGTHVLHDCPDLALNCQLVASPMRLDKASVLQAFVELTGNIADAEEKLEQCHKGGGKPQARLTVAIK